MTGEVKKSKLIGQVVSTQTQYSITNIETHSHNPEYRYVDERGKVGINQVLAEDIREFATDNEVSDEILNSSKKANYKQI